MEQYAKTLTLALETLPVLLIILLYGNGIDTLLSVFWSMQSTTTWRHSKERPNLTLCSKVNTCHIAVASLSPPGCERIPRWTFLNPGRKTSVLYLQWTKNQTGGVPSPLDLCNFLKCHMTNVLVHHISKVQLSSTGVLFLILPIFLGFFLPLTVTILTPFITKYSTIIYNTELHFEACIDFPLLPPASMCPQIPEFSFKWWQDILPFTSKLPLP